MLPARRIEDLIVWQLASRFERWAYAVSDRGPMLRDFKFKSNWCSAAASVPRNLAEGFAKFDPPEFARYVNIAKRRTRQNP